MNPPPRLPLWFMFVLGVSLLGLALQGLLSGVVDTPARYYAFGGQIARATLPGPYWLMVLAYLAGGVLFLWLVMQRWRDPSAPDDEPAPTPRATPRWARGLAWSGLMFAALLLAGAALFHFEMDPILRVPFVVILGGGGLLIGLTSLGYLLTGRAD